MKQKNFIAALAGFLVFLFHLSLAAVLILSCVGMLSWKIFLLLLTLKIIPEFIVLNSVLNFSGKNNLRKYIFPSQLIYPFYLVIVVLLSQTGKYAWKERKVR